MTTKTNDNHDIVNGILSNGILCIILFLAMFGLLIILNDFQIDAWHKTNDICNLTCTRVLTSDQYLDSYYLIHADLIAQPWERTCNCAIHECKTPSCSIYESKTIFVNNTT